MSTSQEHNMTDDTAQPASPSLASMMLLRSKQGVFSLRESIAKGFGDVITWTIVGAINDVVRRTLGVVIEHVTNFLTVTVEVHPEDELYQWLMKWSLAFTNARNARVLVAKTYHKRDGKPEVVLAPGRGTTFFIYKRRLLWISRAYFGSASSNAVKLTSLGRSTAVLKNIVKDVMVFSTKSPDGLIVYINTSKGWEPFGDPRPLRSPDTLILPDNLFDDLFEECRRYLDNPEWYRKRGIPYRRGVLLHGNPGSGKSTFVEVLCGALGLNICNVNLSQDGMSDHALLVLLNKVPQASAILFEDIDTIPCTQQRDETSHAQKGPASRLTFSGLLNAIDGVVGQEGKLLFMTTNKIEKLDPALIREGRVDRRVHLEGATKKQAEQLFAQFYAADVAPADPQQAPTYTLPIPLLAKTFADVIPDKALSMAALQGYLLRYVDNPVGAMEHIQDLMKNINKNQQNHK